MSEVKIIKISKDGKVRIPKRFSNYKGGKAMIFSKEEKIEIKPVPKEAILTENTLVECWNSAEDEKAFAYLQ